MENRIAYLRSDQIHGRLSKLPLVILPVGPLEWHGPHMPYGTDGLAAEHVAGEVARKVGGLLWPALFELFQPDRPVHPACQIDQFSELFVGLV